MGFFSAAKEIVDSLTSNFTGAYAVNTSEKSKKMGP